MRFSIFIDGPNTLFQTPDLRWLKFSTAAAPALAEALSIPFFEDLTHDLLDAWATNHGVSPTELSKIQRLGPEGWEHLARELNGTKWPAWRGSNHEISDAEP